MRDFELVDTQYLQLIDLLVFMNNLQKNALSCDAIR